VAYELGYRVRPFEAVSLDVATLYNDYENLKDFTTRAPDPFNAFADNGSEAHAYGVELALRWFVNDWARAGMNYAGFQMQESEVAGAGIEDQTPHH